MQRPAYYAHAHARFSGPGRAEDMPDACGGLALVLARLASSDQFSTYQHTGEPVSSFPGGVLFLPPCSSHQVLTLLTDTFPCFIPALF